MDRFVYNYHTLGGQSSNRLSYVVDNGTDYSSYDDIKTGQTTSNYTYNKIGELIEDASEDMELEWRYGDHKLLRVMRTDAASPNLEFHYNPFGQRVLKMAQIRSGGVTTGNLQLTFYAYDANGQVMAVYNYDLNEDEYKLNERHLYGAERLGVNSEEVVIYANNTFTPYTHKEEDVVHTEESGHKRYELTNHLGNVLAVINDRKIASGSSGTVFSNDFTSDVSGLVALPNSTLTHAGGELEVSVTSQGSGVQLSYTGTTPGKVYRLYFTADLNSQGSIAAQTYDVPTSTVTSEKVAGSDGVYYLDFLASSSQTTISIVSTVAGSRTFYLDDMVLELRPSVFARSLTSSYAGLQTYGAGVTASIVGHRLEVDNLSLWNGVQCVFPTEVGETYTVHYTLDLDGGPQLTPFVRNNITSANIQVQHIYSDGRYTLTFVAPSTETLFAVENPNSGTRKMYLSYLFVQDNNASVVDDFHYDPVIVSWSDYYAFGMTMPGRNGGVGYRYQFNGMETDNEISGSGNSYTTEFRQYDPRLGRWKSLDPLMSIIPWDSPYSAQYNNPILYNDVKGDIPWPTILKGLTFGPRKGGSAFGLRVHPIHKTTKQHKGIDLPAKEGTKIRAIASGEVLRAGYENNGFGYQVWIDHGNGYVSVYAHMVEQPSVKAGEVVSNGQTIGAVGNTGQSKGNHLHLEIHHYGKHIDPTSIYDLHEKLNGAPEKLTEDEKKEWNNLSRKKENLMIRLDINKSLKDINELKSKDNSHREMKIQKIQVKIDKIDSELNELRKTNASRYVPIIEVEPLQDMEVLSDEK